MQDLSQVQSIAGYERYPSRLPQLLRLSGLGMLFWLALADAVTTWILLDQGWTERNALARWQFDHLPTPLVCVVRVATACAMILAFILLYNNLKPKPRWWVWLTDLTLLAIVVWWTSIVGNNLVKL